MSDFLFSRENISENILIASLKDILPDNKVNYYSGKWGALAVSLGKYKGFDPYENEEYICIVIGGPVLYFQENSFLSNLSRSSVGTRAIFEYWLSGRIDFSEDLSGPFVILIVNKSTCEVFCFTDLMLFIPVYQYKESTHNHYYLGTHVDALAKISMQTNIIDKVSAVDFILNSVITYPYTIYENIYQLAPATKYKWSLINDIDKETHVYYWKPLEVNSYENIDKAAAALRVGLNIYIERITKSMKEVGQFISAGEDSRSIAGLMPEHLDRHAYIFVDYKNREFKLAEKIAKAYKYKFHYILRDSNHYLDILPLASKLVGSGQQYLNAHTLGLVKKSGADRHAALFGGFASDSLLKGRQVKRNMINKTFPFLPKFSYKGKDRNISDSSKIFSNLIIRDINKRRNDYLNSLKILRPKSAYEWFSIWPMTMHPDFPNLSANRRLFASYEIYTSKEVVKISACVPTEWKLNRRLFHKGLKKAFLRSKSIPHADGRLPYYSWFPNMFIQLPFWTINSISAVLKIQRNEGSWADWHSISKSKQWKESYDLKELKGLSIIQKINYAQVTFLLGDIDVF